MYREAGGFAGNVDRWQIVEHIPPCFTVNFAGCSDSKTKIDLMALSAPSPETENTTHYFFGLVRNFGLKDAAKERIFSEGMVKVFREDLPILEAQQRNSDLAGARVDIAVDAAPLAARRMLQALIAKEG